MHRYSRAYRDASSPLTPLTPLSTNAFDFNIDNEAACSTLALPGCAGNSGLPRVRQRVSSTRVATPKSCDSVLKKRNNYIKVIAALGSGANAMTTTRMSPHNTIKNESSNMSRNVPVIKLQPPPCTKRRGGTLAQFNCNVNVKSEPHQTGEYFESGQQQQQLMPTRHFDASKVRSSSPVAPKPMSPRFGAFLARWGINCLKSIFERQEIDLQTFCCLTADDLELLGIQDPVSRERVIQAINFVSGINMNCRLND